MKTYTFTNADGKVQTIAVTDEVYSELKELDKREKLDNRKETRRCQSLEASVDNGWDVIDPNADVEEIYDANQRREKLYIAIAKLLPEQQELVTAVYLDGKSKTEMAERFGISISAISKRIARILAQLKKFLS